ncbi:MAG TPA: hypothetical protein IGS53_13505 [Leptolyngbyaceae cyanobacterium M33_DOE_097]|uniref:Uncharacterized protein n=1 Tax=Oscillatoriales cyanobacterium SpSt-418 TaxID=2282169 RepID=A0A7C3PK06_9CYAN|nr:hypothetical protein [Leptolyngbyaceae cyanobacterium M33_DOE_097]
MRKLILSIASVLFLLLGVNSLRGCTWNPLRSGNLFGGSNTEGPPVQTVGVSRQTTPATGTTPGTSTSETGTTGDSTYSPSTEPETSVPSGEYDTSPVNGGW